MEISMQDIYWGAISRFTLTYGWKARSIIGLTEECDCDTVPAEALANPMGNYTTRTSHLSCPELEGSVLEGTIAMCAGCWIWATPGKGLCSWIRTTLGSTGNSRVVCGQHSQLKRK